jgi:hypothetical protein
MRVGFRHTERNRFLRMSCGHHRHRPRHRLSICISITTTLTGAVARTQTRTCRTSPPSPLSPLPLLPPSLSAPASLSLRTPLPPRMWRRLNPLLYLLHPTRIVAGSFTMSRRALTRRAARVRILEKTRLIQWRRGSGTGCTERSATGKGLGCLGFRE